MAILVLDMIKKAFLSMESGWTNTGYRYSSYWAVLHILCTSSSSSLLCSCFFMHRQRNSSLLDAFFNLISWSLPHCETINQSCLWMFAGWHLFILLFFFCVKWRDQYIRWVHERQRKSADGEDFTMENTNCNAEKKTVLFTLWGRIKVEHISMLEDLKERKHRK